MGRRYCICNGVDRPHLPVGLLACTQEPTFPAPVPGQSVPGRPAVGGSTCTPRLPKLNTYAKEYPLLPLAYWSWLCVFGAGETIVGE
jgi:hypothetical protein